MKLVLDLCEEELQWPGTRVSKRRWEQEGLDMVGVWEESAAALEGKPELVTVKVVGRYWGNKMEEMCST